MKRCYSDLQLLRSLDERYDYLAIGGEVGTETFGTERYINQRFYRSTEWRQAREFVTVRDYGFDLGDPDTPIRGKPIVHHMNPLTLYDIENGTENLLDPEFLISTSLRSHNAIHFGDRSQLPRAPIERRPGDTQLWGKTS